MYGSGQSMFPKRWQFVFEVTEQRVRTLCVRQQLGYLDVTVMSLINCNSFIILYIHLYSWNTKLLDLLKDNFLFAWFINTTNLVVITL